MTRDHLLEPDLTIAGPILGLEAEPLLRAGVRGLVLDVDETLVPSSTEEIAGALHDWVVVMRRHFPIWLVSNNISEARIGGIAAALELPYHLAAGKPSRRKLRLAAEAMDLPVEQVAIVGDRVFTDVLAGNRLGFYTVLVEPMVDPDRTPRSHWWRNLEVRVSQMMGARFHPHPQMSLR